MATQISTNQIKANAVTQNTQVKRTAGNVTTTSTSFVDLTGASATITLTGGDVLVMFTCCADSAATGKTQTFRLVYGSGPTALDSLVSYETASGTNPPALISMVERVTGLPAGSTTFKVQWKVDSGTGNVYADGATGTMILTVVELKK